MARRNRFVFLLSIALIALAAPPLFAQQTGSIQGTITTDGQPLPGVTVEARAAVLPQARVTTSQNSGDYRLPALPPGSYTVTFTLSGLRTQTRNVSVFLNQAATVNVNLALAAVAEEITVTADSPLIDQTSTAIKSAVDQQMIAEVPVGQEYRDLLRLAPGVQVTENEARGPSSGGSEQDNVYLFDGVNVTMPMFGILAAEPSSHDIAQISFVKGGAKAVDFNRAAGFTIDTVSKSGTNEWTGELSYLIQNDSMTADVIEASSRTFDQDKDWATFGIGGPILQERLYFYGSYYRPTVEQANVANAYGEVPNYKSVRDEFFGKLTFTPISSLLLHGSYRDSAMEEDGASVLSLGAPTTSVGGENLLKVAILEGSWVVTDRSYVTAKFTDFDNQTSGVPDVLLDLQPSLAPGTRLDIDNLGMMGQFFVPEPLPNPQTPAEIAFNQFVGPLVNRYGFIRDGVPTGGGNIGVESDINPQDFYRQSAQLGYDFTIGDVVSHDIHVGYQWMSDEEVLARRSNGWGDITFVGGRDAFEGEPVFYEALLYQMTLGDFQIQDIRSEIESTNFEINDTINWGNWAFNAGVLVSKDTYYGQGLREAPETLSGYEAEIGSRYKMHEVDFGDQIQPRLGATWAYNGIDTAYVAYSRYNPAASSLPRAAAWDRNTLGLLVEVYFDENGDLIGSAPRGSSSGKLFQAGIKPRYTDEYLIGTSQQFSDRLSARAFGRYRYSARFWEDTNNTARVAFQPPAGIPREPYIPDLTAKLAQIGSGSSYVIAELDGAFTKYYEVSLESDWRATDLLSLRASYTWSHYYGNFDQDNTTTSLDFVNFIGSSNLADSAGRQIWDNKFGDLRSDRPHLFKAYGSYQLPWNASVGAFALFQSGNAWEAWSYRPYSHLTGNTSVTNRYAEPAGSRNTDDHYQLDMNYTQSFDIGGYGLQFDVDVFNLTDNQTGYNPNPNLESALFGEYQSFFNPRRFQVGVRFLF